MFDRWFTPQESRGILAIVGSLIIGSLVLVAGRSIPEIGDDLHLRPESIEESSQDSLYESSGANEKKDSLNRADDVKENKDTLENADKKQEKKNQKQAKDKKKSEKASLLPASININSASSKELQRLPGIGPGKASTIIEYRESKGLFQKTKDITNVKGIGPKTYEKLKVYLTIE
ncbi:MAG: ComEA family DNA-binding protein [Candidatus Zixiibacteriota bacterium]